MVQQAGVARAQKALAEKRLRMHVFLIDQCHSFGSDTMCLDTILTAMVASR